MSMCINHRTSVGLCNNSRPLNDRPRVQSPTGPDLFRSLNLVCANSPVHHYEYYKQDTFYHTSYGKAKLRFIC